jgi:hypothetical protein
MISPSYLKDATHCPAGGPHRRRLLGHEDVEPTFFFQAAGGWGAGRRRRRRGPGAAGAGLWGRVNSDSRPGGRGHGRARPAAGRPRAHPYAARPHCRPAGLCTGVSIAGSVLLALASLALFKRSPHGMVKASAAVQVREGCGPRMAGACGSRLHRCRRPHRLCPQPPAPRDPSPRRATFPPLTPPPRPQQVAIPAGIALAAFASGAPGAGVPFALMAGLLGVTLYLYRDQLALVGNLLGVSVRALSDQPGILIAALGLQLLGARAGAGLAARRGAGRAGAEGMAAAGPAGACRHDGGAG